MRRFCFFFVLFFVSSVIQAQTAVGVWGDHLGYDRSYDLVVASDEVYSSTGSSILVYDKRYNELRRLSKVNGLTETGIAAIGWSVSQSTLIIGYSNSNVDLLQSGKITNLPDILRKYTGNDKSINRIRCDDKYAYLACGFGIVVVDLTKNEVFDTWRPGSDGQNNSVNDITFGNGELFAATDNGVFRARPGDDGLSFFGNWQRMEELPEAGASYNNAIFSGGRLYVGQHSIAGDNVYVLSSSGDLFFHEAAISFEYFDSSSSGFTFTSPGKIFQFDEAGSPVSVISSYGWGSPEAKRSVQNGNEIWIADALHGMVRYNGTSSFTAYVVNGPEFNDAAFITSAGGVTVATGGGVSSLWGNLGREAMVALNHNNRWSSSSSSIHFDAMRSAVDPTDNSRIFVSTYGTGLLEYKLINGEMTLVNSFRADNSPIEAITYGDTERICGIAFDSKGELWVTQPLVTSNIKLLKKDGSWVLFPNEINSSRIGDIIVTSKGHKWIVLPGGNGLYLFDDNGTPGDFNDDRSLHLTVKDSDGSVYRNVYSVAEDIDGRIWVGTDKGPLIYYTPEKAFETDIRGSRLKIPRGDGTDMADYLLGTETINSIAVDGGNRKWLATKSSGVYLFSADGTKELKHYNESNSPLFSNLVNSVAVDNLSGNVWFATPEGIISLRGDATAGKEGFDNVYAFPNPVRENFEGDMTITGLERNTHVRITDISGNLVYSTVSEGGQATWNLNGYNGRRVATGVYLVFCASNDGTDSTVIKVLVIN